MAAIRRRWEGVAAGRTPRGRRSAAPTSVAVNLTAGMMWASGAEKLVSVMSCTHIEKLLSFGTHVQTGSQSCRHPLGR